jgi:hypothetical protein
MLSQLLKTKITHPFLVKISIAVATGMWQTLLTSSLCDFFCESLQKRYQHVLLKATCNGEIIFFLLNTISNIITT